MLGSEGLDIGPGHSQQGPMQGDIGILGVRDKAIGLHAKQAPYAGAA